jgi:hypothetical protein
MRLRLIALALLAAASVSAAADSVDLNLSSDTIEARYNSSAGFGEWTFGGLYNREQKDHAVNVGLLATGETRAGGSRIDAGLGGKLYATSIGNEEVLALGLGGQLRWFFGDGPFAVSGYGFFAPRVVTFLDGVRFWEAGVRAEVELIKNSFLYIGYRHVQAELDNDVKLSLDKGAFAGLQIKF